MDAGPRLRIAQIAYKRAVVGVELDIEKVLVTVIGRVAIDDAGGGALGPFVRAQDRDADAVEHGIAQRFSPGRFSEGICVQIFGGQGFGGSGQGVERGAIVQRRLHAAGASIAKVEGDAPQQRDFGGGLDDPLSAARVQQRGKEGFGVGLRMALTQLAQLVFESEESPGMGIVVAAGGFGRGAAGEEVIGAETAQFLRAAVVEPLQCVLRIGSVEAADQGQCALADSR